MAANTAFEAITKRFAYYAKEPVSKYQAVQWSTTGDLELATSGEGPLAGVVEYGTDKVNEMATVVTGIYPCIAAAPITKGSYIEFAAGKAKSVAIGVAYGIALNDADTNTLVGVNIFDSPFTIS